jgi:hypothetical protein
MINQRSFFKTIAKQFAVFIGTLILFINPGVAALQPLQLVEASPTQQSHYIIFQSDKNGVVQPIFHRYVNLTTPLKSLSTADQTSQLEGISRDGQKYGYTLRQSKTGQVVFQGVSDIPNWIRGEFQKDGASSSYESNIDGHMFPMDTSVFVVRAPVLADTQLSISDRSGQTFTTIDPVNIRSDAHLDLVADKAAQASIGALSGGNSANRVDLLVMGDGYTAGQSSLFATDYNNLMSQFFGITPYIEYKNYVNVTSLFTASAQSGVDHPPYQAGCSQANPNHPTCCGDSAAASDALAGTYVSTAFDGTFCSYNIHRLVVVDTSKIYAAASASPDWDEILVIVNDSTYGGSGGSIGVFSTNMYSYQVAQHEYGHTFTRLADEYSSAYPGYPSCNDTDAVTYNDCEANVTNQTSRAAIRWNRWIDPGTPIITPPTFPYTDPSVTGLFNGARYLASGMYRPGYNCLMRNLNTDFCAVASEAYAVRLYTGGWGVPAQGIDNIEPGTESPSNSSAIPLVAPNTALISASLLGPDGGPPLDIRWYVNNSQVASGSSSTTASYTFAPTIAGTYTVKLEVTDISPIIHPSLRANFKSSRQWTFNVSIIGTPQLISPAIGASVSTQLPTLTWGVGTNATSYEVQLDTLPTPATVPIPVLGTNYTAPSFLPFGTYYWRVRSVLNSNRSNWSPTRSFTIESSTTVGPARNFFSSASVTFTWNRIDWATNYEVQTNSNQTFTGNFNDVQSLPASQLSATVTLPKDGTYFWRVRAKKSDNTWGAWSSVEIFTVDVP